MYLDFLLSKMYKHAFLASFLFSLDSSRCVHLLRTLSLQFYRQLLVLIWDSFGFVWLSQGLAGGALFCIVIHTNTLIGKEQIRLLNFV